MKLLGSGLISDGQLGNKMFQLMFCSELQKYCSDFFIHRVNIPEFNLLIQERPLRGKTLHLGGGFRHDIKFLTYLLNIGVYDNVLVDTLCLRMEYYPNRNEYHTLFRSTYVPDSTYLGEDYLIIHVRGGDILSAVNSDYGPLPLAFFAQIIDETNLKPVFIGQLGEDFYSQAIRERFRGAVFLEGGSAMQDFQTIRSAKNILVSVSTYSFLASWLAYDAKNIFFPIKGFFNPKQRIEINLLPLGDDRYHFYEFPAEDWGATDAQKRELISATTNVARYAKNELLELISY